MKTKKYIKNYARYTQSFYLKLFHVGKKMPTWKFYNQFHVGKNEIRVGNFQKFVFFQTFN